MKTTNKDHEQFNLPDDPYTPEGFAQAVANIYRLDKDLNIKNIYSFSDREFINRRGWTFNRVALSGNYSASSQDFLIAITSLGTAPTIGLPRPSLVNVGKTFIVKDEAGGAATTTITVRVEGEANIDGSATSTLTANYQSRSYYTDGQNYFNY